MKPVRVWTIGDLSLGIIPSKTAMDKFREMIATIKEDDVHDIVWGSDLNVKVISFDDSDNLNSIKVEYKDEQSFIESLQNIINKG